MLKDKPALYFPGNWPTRPTGDLPPLRPHSKSRRYWAERLSFELLSVANLFKPRAPHSILFRHGIFADLLDRHERST
jgi:hypothetical protein